MSDIWPYLMAALGGYLMGSVPYGLVLTRAAGIDLRSIGSGNIGATNVLRTGRRDLALATLLLDIFKAGLAVWLFMTLFSDRNTGLIAGAAALTGHCYPVWLKFRGGKGVATYAGLLAFVTWKGFFIGLALWAIIFALTRISSLSALTAAVIVPIAAWLLGESGFAVGLLIGLSLLVIWAHRSNIGRLVRGTEPRFDSGKT